MTEPETAQVVEAVAKSVTHQVLSLTREELDMLWRLLDERNSMLSRNAKLLFARIDKALAGFGGGG